MSSNEIRDQLPSDLNVTEFVGAYKFPDNSRRRIPGILYVAVALALSVVWLLADSTSAYANGGIAFACVALGVAGAFSITSGWRMTVDEKEALLIATREVGHAVGHASAQQVWRGLRSRPTWRIFCYSAEEPPAQRSLVLVDAITGRVVESLTEANPEGNGTPTLTGSD